MNEALTPVNGIKKPIVKNAFHTRQKIDPVQFRFHRQQESLIAQTILATVAKMGEMSKSDKWEEFLSNASLHGVTITLVVAVVDE